MTYTIAKLSRAALAARRDFADVLEEAGISTPRYDAGLNPRPLCYLHVPKTGGASLIGFLESMFDRDEICPAYSSGEFRALSPDELAQFKLFRGHIFAAQIAALPAANELFTVLRPPADWARSMYDHFRHISFDEAIGDPRETKLNLDTYEFDQDDWRDMLRDLLPDSKLRGDERPFRLLYAEAAELCRNYTLPDVLAQENELTTICFADAFLRTLALQDHLVTWREAVDPDLYAGAKRERFAAAAEGAERLLTDALVAGDYAELETALFTLCDKRCWPAPPPLPRIHDVRAKSGGGNRPTAEVAALVRRRSPYDERLYAIARQRCAADKETLMARASGHASIANYLNSRAKERFFREAQPVLGFFLGADRAWMGPGWGPRLFDERGAASREMAGEAASVFARLEPAFDYLVVAEIIRASDMAALEAVALTVNGYPLQRASLIYRSPGDPTQITWHVPAAAIQSADGCTVLEFSFATPRAAGTSVEFGRLICQPWPR